MPVKPLVEALILTIQRCKSVRICVRNVPFLAGVWPIKKELFMSNPTTSEPNVPPKKKPNLEEGQEVQPSEPEINPAKPGNETEVDLDKSKTKTYPDKTPPERH
jgi:hypothetical protein